MLMSALLGRMAEILVSQLTWVEDDTHKLDNHDDTVLLKNSIIDLILIVLYQLERVLFVYDRFTECAHTYGKWRRTNNYKITKNHAA